MKKYNMDSLMRMHCDGVLEETLDCYESYIEFLEDTWFYEGYVNQDEEYMTIFEPAIIAFYKKKGELL